MEHVLKIEFKDGIIPRCICQDSEDYHPCDCWDDDLETTLTCGKSKNCSVWFECRHKDCADIEITHEMEMDGWYTLHEVDHQQIEDFWGIETNTCGGHYADDDLWDIIREHGIGEHEVEVDYGGDGCWNLNYLGPHDSTKSEISDSIEESSTMEDPNRIQEI